MGNDHEDYETGAAPAAHKVSHQDGGTDEISVAGLSGETAKLSAHKILPSIHHVKFTAAEARAAINNIFGADGVADSHISMGGHNLQSVANPTVPLDAVNYGFASGLITNHAALPTVHQDAPGLIETHRLVAGAHHAKYTDAEARALHSPLSVAPSSFFPRYDTNDWELGTSYIKNRITLNAQNFYAGLFFPDNITITKVTFYAYRTDALATIQLQLLRNNRAGTSNIMSSLIPDWTSGYSSMYDDSISNDVVDNSLYFYFLQLYINPNDSTLDALLSGVKIDFTG